ncbi:MAG: nitroreductase family protein [Muribaculaceae bacterium]|nr:nitroreductase family protein [Muribaculaceae bacterium]
MDSKINKSALDCIMTRTSVRSYSDKEISRETVETILRAAMAAPSAMNKQPWHFFVIRGEQLRDTIADTLEYGRQSLRNAKMAVVVAGDRSRFFEDVEAVDYWLEDCSAAAENLLLAAHALGLGAVWCGVYPIPGRIAQLRKATGLSGEFVPMCIIPLGYPAGVEEPKDKWDPDKVTYLD